MTGGRPSLVRGTMMIATSLALAGALTFVISIAIARSVGVTEFGYYSMTVSLQNVVILFSSFSIGMAVTKYVAEYLVRDFGLALRFAKTGLQLVLLLASVTTILYFVLADLIGNGLYSEPTVADLIPFSALVTFSSAMLAFSSGLAQGNQRLRLVSAIQISTPVISLSAIILLLPGLGVRSAFIGYFVAQITVALIAMMRLNGTGFPVLRISEAGHDASQFRTLLSFAVPSVLSAVMVTPVLWFGNTVLALNSGFTAMGYFGVAFVFFLGLNMLANSVSIPLVPRVSEMSVRSVESIGPLISGSIRAVAFAFFPLFFAVALFSGEIISALYGSDFSESRDAAYLMVSACYFCAAAAPIGAAIFGLGRMWVALGLNMAWAAMFVGLVLVLVPSQGTVGLGMSFAISYGIHVLVSLAVADRVLHLNIGKVLVSVAPAAVFFALSLTPFMELGETDVPTRALLLALGSAFMLFLGREDVRHVMRRFLRP